MSTPSRASIITKQSIKEPVGLQIKKTKYGLRNDGTEKGEGWLGPRKIPNTNDIVTEYSFGVGFDGVEREIPSLVPGLSENEINSVLEAARDNKPIPKEVEDKAIAHARKMIREGKDVWAPVKKEG